MEDLQAMMRARESRFMIRFRCELDDGIGGSAFCLEQQWFPSYVSLLEKKTDDRRHNGEG
jgi:hypothetical protein